jgi:hypothetical protein
MAQKRRDMKSKKSKPTNKELTQEINYLGGRLVQLENIVRNTIVVVDNYIQFKGDDEEYKKYLESKKRKETSVKDILDSESSSKKEKPKKAKIA